MPRTITGAPPCDSFGVTPAGPGRPSRQPSAPPPHTPHHASVASVVAPVCPAPLARASDPRRSRRPRGHRRCSPAAGCRPCPRSLLGATVLPSPVRHPEHRCPVAVCDGRRHDAEGPTVRPGAGRSLLLGLGCGGTERMGQHCTRSNRGRLGPTSASHNELLAAFLSPRGKHGRVLRCVHTCPADGHPPPPRRTAGARGIRCGTAHPCQHDRT